MCIRDRVSTQSTGSPCSASMGPVPALDLEGVSATTTEPTPVSARERLGLEATPENTTPRSSREESATPRSSRATPRSSREEPATPLSDHPELTPLSSHEMIITAPAEETPREIRQSRAELRAQLAEQNEARLRDELDRTKIENQSRVNNRLKAQLGLQQSSAPAQSANAEYLLASLEAENKHLRAQVEIRDSSRGASATHGLQLEAITHSDSASGGVPSKIKPVKELPARYVGSLVGAGNSREISEYAKELPTRYASALVDPPPPNYDLYFDLTGCTPDTSARSVYSAHDSLYTPHPISVKVAQSMADQPVPSSSARSVYPEHAALYPDLYSHRLTQGRPVRDSAARAVYSEHDSLYTPHPISVKVAQSMADQVATWRSRNDVLSAPSHSDTSSRYTRLEYSYPTTEFGGSAGRSLSVPRSRAGSAAREADYSVYPVIRARSPSRYNYREPPVIRARSPSRYNYREPAPVIRARSPSRYNYREPASRWPSDQYQHVASQPNPTAHAHDHARSHRSNRN
eukprot:TRINITY_DN3025_c0_g2_i2.p1 TRINITY_DN3025_c0_g2~~TRINITY_DN3025_c0_g2_i2.p1  ORF type:complete len:519 (+),score=38.71 TRINITY_DN3025_c0_g2_i2:146-1702(+)